MRYALAPLLALLLLAACRSGDDVAQGEEGQLRSGREAATAVTERSVGLGERTLVLDVEAGALTVVGTDATEASLRFERVGRGATPEAARRDLDRITIEEIGDAETYRYVAQTGGSDGARVHVEARVPRGTALDLRLRRGPVRLSGTAGNVRVENQNGSIEAAGLAGNTVTLTTRLGTVRAGFAALPAEADVEIETENGDLVLTVPPDASADLDVRTATGNVSVQNLTFADQTLSEEGTGTAFQARLGSGAADLHATTQVGTIELHGGRSLELDALDLTEPGRDDSTIVPPGAPVPPSDG